MSATRRHAVTATIRRVRWLARTALLRTAGFLRARGLGPDAVPRVGAVRFGSLRRVRPISREFGYDRGQPVDRYYIERFLDRHADDVQGRVLEVGDATYTRRYGGRRVTHSDVLHVHERAPGVTIVADLSDAPGITDGSYDCVILTQTLQLIWDVPAALATVRRILRPGGVVLATVPGISPVSRYDAERWGHFWSFTSQSARRLFHDAFPDGEVTATAEGNVLAATAFLYGLSSRELKAEELDYRDPDYELMVLIRAVVPDRAANAGDG